MFPNNFISTERYGLPWGMFEVSPLLYMLTEKPNRLPPYERWTEVKPKHIDDVA